MPTTSELIEARLAFTRKGLDEAIGRLNQEMMSWAPATGMRTIAGQLVEIAGSEIQIVAIMQGGDFISDEEVRARIGDVDDLGRLVEYLPTVREGTLAYLHSLSERQLEAEVACPGWHESLGLPITPRSEIFRGIAQHEAYHTGQLVSYLWARGDNPYKW